MTGRLRVQVGPLAAMHRKAYVRFVAAISIIYLMLLLLQSDIKVKPVYEDYETLGELERSAKIQVKLEKYEMYNLKTLNP